MSAMWSEKGGEEWQLFKSVMVGCKEVFGLRRVGSRVRKESECWCEDVRVRGMALKCDCRGRIRCHMRYKEKRNQAKRAVCVAKVSADD